MNTVSVLLVDDHAVARAGIRNALTSLPALRIVGEAEDGVGLFQVLEETQPDCLLIDVAMPNFEPISAISRIRALYPTMKILIISAYDDDIYVQGLLGLGVDGYHLKDQPLSDLRLAVERVVAGERWVSSRLVDKLVRPSDFGAISQTQLTTRQRDILRLLQKGLDNRSIAQQLGLSVKTVETHLTRLYRQIDVQSRLEAVNYAMEHPEVLSQSGDTTVFSLESSRSAVSNNRSILLVDDNGRYRHQLKRMIGGISPKTAIYETETIQETVQLVQRMKPRLIFVDVVLGDESGIRCTEQISRISPASRVVLISAYPDSEFHRLGLQAGAIAFLDKKNLDIATLHQVIDDVLA